MYNLSTVILPFTVFESLSHVQLCDSVDCGQPGSSVHGISQPRTLEEVAISFSRGSPRPRNWTRISCTAGRFFTTEPQEKSHYVLLAGNKCLL